VRLNKNQSVGIAVRLGAVEKEFEKVKSHPRAADAHIFLKAVRYAAEMEEWYEKTAEDSARKAHALLEEAGNRIEALKLGETPWMAGSGQKVLGFYSQIDGSPQPYGVEIPEGLEWGGEKKKVPMWIWLHGRGDTATDLNFVYSRLMAKKPGQFQPKGTIVIHPFGRYCNGWKSAGETDVFECRDDAVARFKVDQNRIALAGFSMGGAGAWHMGAHHAGHWACVHTGAGFADVKRYQKLTPEKYPVWYEQKLWGVYDVPDYARNFFNVPLICYSGEQDAQRDSAEYMIEVLGKEGIKPPHLIGPGMGHKYHPETIQEVQAWIEKAVEKGRDPWPKKVSIQTKTLEYGVGGSAWAGIFGLEEHWKDSRLDAEIVSEGAIHVTTQGVTHCNVRKPSDWSELPEYRIRIDGQELVFPKILSGKPKSFLKRVNGKWNAITSSELGFAPTRKDTSLMGPIDHIFKWRFTVVLPDGPGNHPKVDQWVKEESQHFLKRWRSLMRGDVRVIKAGDVTEKELNDLNSSLVLWGDPQSNKWIRHFQEKLPIRWDADHVGVGKSSFQSDGHVPVLIYPMAFPEGSARYVAINSGLTFREAHDRTNSLQNPKLPDWAILDITQPPNDETAGKVVEADFFDEHWKVKTSVRAQ
jgi:predicted esterase